MVRPLFAALFLVALLWTGLAALDYSCDLDSAIFDTFRVFAAAGSAIFLISVVALGLRRQQDQAGALVTLLVALCLGLAASLLTYLLLELPSTGLPGDKPAPLDPLNALAAVLAVILAVMTFVAQKAAVDARLEAEKARATVVEALDVRLLALAGRLIQLALDCSMAGADYRERASSPLEPGQARFRLNSSAATALTDLSKFLAQCHRALLDPVAGEADEVIAKATTLRLDLEILKQALAGGLTPGMGSVYRQLRRHQLLPAARLIEQVTGGVGGWAGAPPPADLTALVAELRKVRRLLEEF